MPNKELLLRFAEVKIQIAKYESELEMIKDQVLREVQELRGDTDSPVTLNDLPGYSFSIMKRKTWEYPEYVKQAIKNLEKEKKHAEQTGSATFTETEHLLFKSPKE